MAARGAHFPLEELLNPVDEQTLSGRQAVCTFRYRPEWRQGAPISSHRHVLISLSTAQGVQVPAHYGSHRYVHYCRCLCVSCFKVEQFGLSPTRVTRSTATCTRVNCHLLTAARGLNWRSSGVGFWHGWEKQAAGCMELNISEQ
jgi:hypothetical protein